jgi:hypothetical protein
VPVVVQGVGEVWLVFIRRTHRGFAGLGVAGFSSRFCDITQGTEDK